MTMTGFLGSAIAFALVIGPLIFLHELGHYLAGRWFGVKAEEFSVGFGRELFGLTDRRGTRWKFCLLPLGGYVRFAGDMDMSSREDPAWQALPDKERSQTFPAKPLWQRAIIVAAGPVTNLLIAFLIIAGFAMIVGRAQPTPVIGEVVAGGAAARAGLMSGDRITAFDGTRIGSFVDIFDFVKDRPGKTVTVRLVRDGNEITRPLTVGSIKAEDQAGHSVEMGRIGVGPQTLPVPFLEVPGLALRSMGLIIGTMGQTIGQIIIGQQSADQLGGPLRIAQVSGEQMAAGIAPFISLIALVSINLGFINLLPVPVLDGGHLLFYAIEAVRRRPLEPHIQDWAFRGGLMAVLALMLFATANDLGAFGLWKSLSGLIG